MAYEALDRHAENPERKRQAGFNLFVIRPRRNTYIS